MTVYSVFRASGDSCPMCLAVEGQRVPHGYKPHPECQCETIVVHEDENCTWHFESPGQHGGAIEGIEVEVFCPDGSTIGGSVAVDVSEFLQSSVEGADPVADALIEAAEDEAMSLCQECPEPNIV
jgi:hypothetical protein